MLISLLLFLGILFELNKCNKIKHWFIIGLFLIYTIVNLFDFYFLIEVFDFPFHLSDPSYYYNHGKTLTLAQVWTEEFEYAFFFTIEWIYIKLYESSYIVSLLVRLNNVLLIIYTYLLISKKCECPGKLDLALMLNPYLLFILNRNMRDVYLLFFITLILLSFNFFGNDNTIKKKWGIISIPILFTLRPICLVPFGLMYIINLYKRNRKLAIILSISFVFALVLNFNLLFERIVNQSVGVAAANGEDVEEFASLFENTTFSLGMLAPLLKRYVVGTVAMFFTPHPINYWNAWFINHDITWTYGIYYWFDNIMIIIGALFTYLFVIPKIINYCISNKFWLNNAALYVISYMIIYIIGYLGISDVRNHQMIYFFFLATMINGKPKLNHTKISFIFTIMVFLFLCIKH